MHLQLTKEACNDLEAGGVTEFPPERLFFISPGGFLSPNEIARLTWQEFGGNPILVTIERVNEEPRIVRFAPEAVADKLREGRSKDG